MTRQVYDTLQIVTYVFDSNILSMGKRFAEWLKDERKARHLSIRQLAQLSDFSHSHIAKIEREEAIITWDFCAAIAKAFNEPVWKIFLKAGLVDKVPNEVFNDEEIRVLVSCFEKLPNQGKDELLRYAAWLVHQHSNK